MCNPLSLISCVTGLWVLVVADWLVGWLNVCFAARLMKVTPVGRHRISLGSAVQT